MQLTVRMVTRWLPSHTLQLEPLHLTRCCRCREGDPLISPPHTPEHWMHSIGTPCSARSFSVKLCTNMELHVALMACKLHSNDTGRHQVQMKSPASRVCDLSNKMNLRKCLNDAGHTDGRVWRNSFSRPKMTTHVLLTSSLPLARSMLQRSRVVQNMQQQSPGFGQHHWHVVCSTLPWHESFKQEGERHKLLFSISHATKIGRPCIFCAQQCVQYWHQYLPSTGGPLQRQRRFSSRHPTAPGQRLEDCMQLFHSSCPRGSNSF